jgi:phospholipid/cholesterol/gamma-HCH transport system substrate-binding protein
MKQERKYYFGVGTLVLLGLIAMTFLGMQMGAKMMVFRESMIVNARFQNLSGLKKGSSILLAGVPVGQVIGIDVDLKTMAAVAELKIRGDLKLPVDTMASIRTSGLIGDKFIALAPGAEDLYLNNGAWITLTESTVDLESLISRFAFGSVEKKENK